MSKQIDKTLTVNSGSVINFTNMEDVSPVSFHAYVLKGFTIYDEVLKYVNTSIDMEDGKYLNPLGQPYSDVVPMENVVADFCSTHGSIQVEFLNHLMEKGFIEPSGNKADVEVDLGSDNNFAIKLKYPVA